MEKKKILVLTCYKEKQDHIARLIEESSEFMIFNAFSEFSSYSSSFPMCFNLPNVTENPDLIIISLPPDCTTAVLTWASVRSIPTVVVASKLPQYLLISIRDYYSKMMPIFMFSNIKRSIRMRIISFILHVSSVLNGNETKAQNDIVSKSILSSVSFLIKQKKGFYSLDSLLD